MSEKQQLNSLSHGKYVIHKCIHGYMLAALTPKIYGKRDLYSYSTLDELCAGIKELEEQS